MSTSSTRPPGRMIEGAFRYDVKSGRGHSAGSGSSAVSRARVLDEGPERERALRLLAEKYPQYRTEPPDGRVLAVGVTEVRDWAS